MPLLPLLLALAIAAEAEGSSGRVVLGVSGATGVSPIEPTWDRPHAPSAAIACVGVTAWRISGGHEYAGPRGQVLRTSDETRWGASTALCPTGTGGLAGGLGAAYGKQWGGQLYITSNLTAGVSAYTRSGPEGARYAAIAPYAKPQLAVGLALPPGMSIEAGPYLWIAPPLFQAARADVPLGMFVGHFGLEFTVFVGAASPQVPWR